MQDAPNSLPEQPASDTPNGTAPATESSAPATAARAPRGWKQWVLYFFAGLGVLVLALVVLAVVQSHKKPVKVSIDGDEMINQVMLNTYGKYSQNQGGWLYVGPGNITYLMQVVQRAKPTDSPLGDELYFVASGEPVDKELRGLTMTGLFLVKADADAKDGSLVQISSAFNTDYGNRALRAEDVKFEALSQSAWGWVLKTHTVEGRDQSIYNLVLAPLDDNIQQLARFPAQLLVKPELGCAHAEQAYREFLARQTRLEQGVAAASPASAASDSADSEETDTLEEEPPTRCSDAQWSYRTEAVPAEGFVSILVTGGGMVEGEARAKKTVKLVFDHNKKVYLVPDELSGL